MPKVVLNGQTFDSRSISGLDAVTATIRRQDDTGGAAFSFTGELVFFGEAYDIVRSLIIDAPLPHLVKVPIEIYSDECPDYPFIGYLEGANVDWCEVSTGKTKCYAKASIVDGSQPAEKLACIKNTIIWARLPKFGSTELSSGEDTARKGRYFAYCIEMRPKALQEILMLYYLMQRTILTPAIFAIAAIIAVINGIITAINTIPFVPNIPLIDFDGNDDTNIFEEFLALLNQIQDFITGCGAKHKAPFVSSYVQNVCEICGLTLQSSILSPGGTHHDLTRLDAPQYASRPGSSEAKIESTYLANAPNLNGGQFLDGLRKDLNWEWWLDGDVLRIEPAGNVDGHVWFTQGDGVVIKSFCLGTTDETVKAYGVYDYQEDAVDNSGNEVRTNWGAVIDWNNPPTDTQRGAKERIFPYGATLFRKDKQGDSIPIDKDIYNNNFAFGNLAQWKNAIVLSKGVSSLPKLLMWDGVSPQDNARVQRWKIGDLWDYNYQMWFRESHPSGVETLYKHSFEKTDNPRMDGVRLRTFTMDICLTCELLATAPIARTVKAYIGGVLKDGKIEQININYGKMTAQISGKI